MSGYDDLAKMLKERDNPKQIGIMVGTVTSTSPVSVAIGSIFLSEDRLIVARNLLDREEEVLINGVKSIVEYKDVLAIGDEVMIQPTADKKTFLILEKVGGHYATE